MKRPRFSNSTRLQLLVALAAAFLIQGCASGQSKTDDEAASEAGTELSGRTGFTSSVPAEADSKAAELAEDLTPIRRKAAGKDNDKSTRKGKSKKSSGGAKAYRVSGNTLKYTVKRGDTLMKIAFEVFGDVYRWREILNQNQDRVSGLGQLKVGTELNISAEGYVVIERNGKPYLIRWGDTLIKISDSLYGSPFKWRKIWKNNLQLIHDPNKIYAGFTLYYAMTPEEEAEAQRLRATPRGPASLKPSK